MARHCPSSCGFVQRLVVSDSKLLIFPILLFTLPCAHTDEVSVSLKAEISVRKLFPYYAISVRLKNTKSRDVHSPSPLLNFKEVTILVLHIPPGAQLIPAAISSRPWHDIEGPKWLRNGNEERTISLIASTCIQKQATLSVTRESDNALRMRYVLYTPTQFHEQKGTQKLHQEHH